MLRLTLLFLLLATVGPVAAQTNDSIPETIHAVNPWFSVPVVAVGYYVGYRGVQKIQDKEDTPLSDFLKRDRDDVPGIDRIALRQDLSKRDDAAFISDYLFSAGQAAPLPLFFWKKYRKDWWKISLMYLKAQAVQGLLYSYAPFGPGQTDRYRPYTYYEEAPLGARLSGQERNSLMSGHVSTTATGFYFVAKIIDDYNPQFTTGQRVMLYAGATLPVAASGILRVRALKHFPTDVAIGTAVGAFSGIMIPNFHKWWQKRHRSRASLVPIYGNRAVALGFNLTY